MSPSMITAALALASVSVPALAQTMPLIVCPIVTQTESMEFYLRLDEPSNRAFITIGEPQLSLMDQKPYVGREFPARYSDTLIRIEMGTLSIAINWATGRALMTFGDNRLPDVPCRPYIKRI